MILNRKMVKKMRLIDANKLKKKSVPYSRGEYGYSAKAENWAVLVKDINNAPTIYPETLPIVQELREKLERVTAERDELASLSGKLVVLCEQPEEWRRKLFKRHQGPMIGDYMGSGYPFIDAFDRIYMEFEEKASNGAYATLRKVVDAAFVQEIKNDKH